MSENAVCWPLALWNGKEKTRPPRVELYPPPRRGRRSAREGLHARGSAETVGKACSSCSQRVPVHSVHLTSLSTTRIRLSELAQPQRAYNSPGSRTFQSSVGEPRCPKSSGTEHISLLYCSYSPAVASPEDTVPHHWLLIRVTGADKCRPK